VFIVCLLLFLCSAADKQEEQTAILLTSFELMNVETKAAFRAKQSSSSYSSVAWEGFKSSHVREH
jgi:hypothetical protein